MTEIWLYQSARDYLTRTLMDSNPFQPTWDAYRADVYTNQDPGPPSPHTGPPAKEIPALGRAIKRSIPNRSPYGR